MKQFLLIAVINLCFPVYLCFDHCIIDTTCHDCLPDNAPMVLSHQAVNNYVTIFNGEEALLHCQDGNFVMFPGNSSISVICDRGHFRITDPDTQLQLVLPFSELGCKESIFKAVTHTCRYCNYNGMSYQYQPVNSSGVVHLAEVCYDLNVGQTIFAHMTFDNNNDIVHEAHSDNAKMNYMESVVRMLSSSQDGKADKVYSSPAAMNKAMLSLLGKQMFDFNEQTLVAEKLLPQYFFYDQNGRVAMLSSNNAAVWKSVSNGNLANVRRDIVSSFKYNTSNVDVYVGTHNTLSLPIGSHSAELYLRSQRKFPVPEYIWTMVYNKVTHEGAVVITLNNPFVAISEIKSKVFCASVCTSLQWARELRHNHNYERPGYGLTFCCDVPSFTSVVHLQNMFSNSPGREMRLLKSVEIPQLNNN